MIAGLDRPWLVPPVPQGYLLRGLRPDEEQALIQVVNTAYEGERLRPGALARWREEDPAWEADALGYLGEKRALYPLILMLTRPEHVDGNAVIRLACAARALGRVGDLAAVPVLCRTYILYYRIPDVRIEAGIAIEACAARAKNTLVARLIISDCAWRAEYSIPAEGSPVEGLRRILKRVPRPR